MPLSQIVSASIEDGAVAPVDLSSVAQYTGFKNRLINGGMGIWQRGTSTSTLGAYLADRWATTASTSVTTTRSTDVPSGFQYSLSLAGTNYPQAYQKIESVNTQDLVGHPVTLSFWLKQTSGAGASSLVAYIAYANAVDNFSGVTVISSTIFTGTTSWAQYSVTFPSMPSLITNGAQVTVYANTTGAATFLVTGVQLEKGVTATSFDYRPYGTELQLCQRYYETGATGQSLNNYGFTASVSYTHTFKASKRATPTCNVATGAIQVQTTEAFSSYQSGIPNGSWYNPSSFTASAEL
jgi:hypothetical protein